MTLTSTVDSIVGLKILVIGDLMLDHYVWGDVHRISPEAPVPVVLATHDTWTAGGAANVALNLSNLGVVTTVAGCVSNDEAGQRLRSILNENKIGLIGEVSSTDAPPTIVKSRVIARTQQVCRIDREVERARYRIDTNPELLNAVKEAVNDSDAIIVSDYAKGVVTNELIRQLVEWRQGRKTLLAVDPKPSHLISLTGVDLMTPNRHEALQLAGLSDFPATEKYPLSDVCRRIHELYRPQTLVVTLGAEGMAVSRNGDVEIVLPTLAQEVFDVSGAGDTVIAVLTAAMAAGVSAVQAAQVANAAAGCVVAHVGTVPVNRDELVAFLSV